MAAAKVDVLAPIPLREEEPAAPSPTARGAFATYLGASFAVFLGLLPRAAAAHLCALQSRNRSLALQLRHAEEQIRQMRSRRREDSKANARVVEIFASHRNAWQQDERRLLARIDAASGEAAALRARVEELEASERELRERLVRKEKEAAAKEVEEEQEEEEVEEEREVEARARMEAVGMREAWGSSSDAWQSLQFQLPLESIYPVNHFTPRKDSPWKGGCEAAGLPVKLKQADQELDNLEKLGKIELSTIRKQAKRYQSLTAKIDDLCKRMQAGDQPSELPLSPEFRTQSQTEFLLEACRLQHRATESRQKLTALQADMSGSSSICDELVALAKVDARKLLDSLRINFKEIQRNLEVLLARIIGDIEGILAREGASRVKDYCFYRHPFVR